MVRTNGTNLLGRFLREVREDSRVSLRIESAMVSIDGMNGSGKDWHGNKLEDTLRKEGMRVITHRATSLVKSSERVSYHDEVVRTLREDLDKTLELYARDLTDAWERYIVPSAKEDGIIILDRSPYSTLAVQFILRSIDPGSREAFDLAQKLFRDPMVPPGLAIFTVCAPQIAYERALQRRRDARSEFDDVFDPYYKVAYAQMHRGAQNTLEVMRKWWLETTKDMYERLRKVVPDGVIIQTGRKTDRLHPEIYFYTNKYLSRKGSR